MRNIHYIKESIDQKKISKFTVSKKAALFLDEQIRPEFMSELCLRNICFLHRAVSPINEFDTGYSSYTDYPF